MLCVFLTLVSLFGIGGAWIPARQHLPYYSGLSKSDLDLRWPTISLMDSPSTDDYDISLEEDDGFTKNGQMWNGGEDEDLASLSNNSHSLTSHEWERLLLQSRPPPRKNHQQKNQRGKDPFWENIRRDAKLALQGEHAEQEAGPTLYQGILSHKSLLTAVSTIISHELENDLVGATELRDLFLGQLTPDDEYAIRLDLQAVATRSPSIETAMEALLFHKGFHALVCYRVGHRLWKADRKGLAYYMQSIVSRVYSCDIHPAARMGYGTYLRGAGSGIVIGETATIGNDCSILQGVTLGGTGKEKGNRHPKVGNGVILQDGSTVLGNIPVEDGSIVMAKSIVTKPVPPLGEVSGVPAKPVGTRKVGSLQDFTRDDMQEHLAYKYLDEWQALSALQESSEISKE